MVALTRRSVVIALVACVATGCKKDKLTEIAVPDAGVSLRYDLAPGQAYGGHLRMRNAVQTPLGEVLTLVELDVDMVVAGPVGDASLVRAKVSEVELELRLPEGIPKEMASTIPPEAVAAVNGMELRFNLDAMGTVSGMPEPPADASEEIKAVVAMVSLAVQSGLVRVPEQAVKQGDKWDVPKGDDPNRTGTGTFTGMARDEKSGSEVAKLAYAIQSSGEAAPSQPGRPARGPSKTQIDALFSVQGYPVKVQRKVNIEIKGVGGLSQEIEAQWKKLDKRAVEPPTAADAPSGEEQAITDPCDPDYVGPEECKPAAPPAGDDGADAG